MEVQPGKPGCVEGGAEVLAEGVSLMARCCSTTKSSLSFARGNSLLRSTDITGFICPDGSIGKATSAGNFGCVTFTPSSRSCRPKHGEGGLATRGFPTCRQEMLPRYRHIDPPTDRRTALPRPSPLILRREAL